MFYTNNLFIYSLYTLAACPPHKLLMQTLLCMKIEELVELLIHYMSLLFLVVLQLNDFLAFEKTFKAENAEGLAITTLKC